MYNYAPFLVPPLPVCPTHMSNQFKFVTIFPALSKLRTETVKWIRMMMRCKKRRVARNRRSENLHTDYAHCTRENIKQQHRVDKTKTLNGTSTENQQVST